MSSAKPRIQIVVDAGELSRVAAVEFVRRACEAVHARGVCTVALAGGSTLKSLYALLAGDGEGSWRSQMPWDKVHFFWGDERHVPPDHPDSNYRMADEAMLAKVPVPPSHEPDRLVVAAWVEKFNTYRLTLTPPVLNNAAAVVFLVSGEDKAETLRVVLQGDYQPDRWPSQLIRPTQGTLLWLVDRAAARRLRSARSAETAASGTFSPWRPRQMAGQ